MSGIAGCGPLIGLVLAWLRLTLAGLGIAAAAAAIAVGAARAAGHAPPSAGGAGSGGAPARWSSQEVLIPAPEADVAMITTVLLPPGRGPFPLAVVNHGTTENADVRAQYPLPTFPLISSQLLQQGYVVALPQRPGHGQTGGPYLESVRGCDDADFAAAGYAAADSIEAAVAYLLREPYVKKQSVLLVGHSAGAWGSLALASRTTGLIAKVVDFAGGLGGHSNGIANSNCAPERLVSTAAQYGRTTRVSTLWLYAQNDSYFAPSLSRRMADAFRAAGGRVDYRLLPPVGGEDGHYLIYSTAAARSWGPIVEQFSAKPP